MSTLTRERATWRVRLLPAAAAAAFLAAATLSGTAISSLLLAERPALELTTPQAGLLRPEGHGFLRATEPSSYRGAAFIREQYAAGGGHLERAEETPLSRTGYYYRLRSGHLEHMGLQEGASSAASAEKSATPLGRQPLPSFA